MLSTLFMLYMTVIVYAYPEEDNKDEDGVLFSSDMMLTPKQWEQVLDGGDILISHDRMTGRAAMRNHSVLWLPHRIVPYRIDPSLENLPEATLGIMKAFREWEENSCLSFKQRTDEEDYINMFKAGGCWSYVGRRGGRQNISLGEGCYGVGTVVHEIGHAVGFGHEQNRPDRDDFIEVRLENVPAGKRHNFRKYSNSEVDSLGSAYDYLSFMQYSMTAFGINDSFTLIPKQKDVFQLGQRVGFTASDRFQAMGLYRCDGKPTRESEASTIIQLPGRDDCTFENGMCHFIQDSNDDFDWTQAIGGTPSYGTGPETDHTTQRIGTFLFIEASSPTKKGHIARLYSRKFSSTDTPRCLSFFFHMYAEDSTMMGSFRVNIKDSKSQCERTVFSKDGSQSSNDWLEARVGFTPASDYQIVFEAQKGSGYQGDISIDDISFSDGSCSNVPSRSRTPVKYEGPCEDIRDREASYCLQWKVADFCNTRAAYMKKFCRKTCSFC